MLKNEHNISLAVAVWLAASGDYDLVPDPKVISATTFLNPIKSIVLSRRALLEGDIDIHDVIASKLGSAVHSAIERAWLTEHREAMVALGLPSGLVAKTVVNPADTLPRRDIVAVYVEQRRNKELDGYIVSGKYDLVIDGRLTDIKTTSTYTYIRGTNESKWATQGSIYRWLNPELITDPVMNIEYVFTDWSPFKAKADPAGYPQKRVLTKELRLMPLDETERYLKDRLAMIALYDQEENQDKIPECGKEELWMEDSKFAYYKNPQKTARATRVFDTQQEAMTMNALDGGKGLIVERPGEPKFCKYCAANSICTQAEKYVLEGRLTL
jgi:hypothetical protein